MDWHISVSASLRHITFQFKIVDMQSYLGYLFFFFYHHSVLTADICFGWIFVIYDITCPATMTHHITTLVWAECCYASLFELGVSSACQSIFGKMTFMIHDLCRFYCWSWRSFEGLWHASLKLQVQLIKWGHWVTFSLAYGFKNA